MSRPIPQWADPKLSADLPKVCECGESATVEFKAEFPKQAHDLAKELAAFGTCGGGTVYIGIEKKDNKLVGLKPANAGARDDAHDRARGIVNSVKPTLKAHIKFASHRSKTILAIQVAKQDEPVFYSNHIPYYRQDRQSRPATPEEVKKCVWAHPSSERQRAHEKILMQMEQDNADGARRRQEAADEGTRRSSEVNDMVRRRVAEQM